jgi:hypothetical protein
MIFHHYIATTRMVIGRVCGFRTHDKRIKSHVYFVANLIKSTGYRLLNGLFTCLRSSKIVDGKYITAENLLGSENMLM